MQFFLEVFIGGLLSGIMYSLVALGYVLIYKASGVFNFAQGAMVFFAALTFVGVLELGAPFWLGLILTCAAMVLLAVLTERIVLRPLVNQPQITLFMATIGLAFLIEGLAQGVWGANVRALELGIQDQPIAWVMNRLGVGISKFDLFAAGVSAVLVTILAIFFTKTRVGRALRAVADDHQAALSIGIPLQNIWRIVWSVAGFVPCAKDFTVRGKYDKTVGATYFHAQLPERFRPVSRAPVVLEESQTGKFCVRGGSLEFELLAHQWFEVLSVCDRAVLGYGEVSVLDVYWVGVADGRGTACRIPNVSYSMAPFEGEYLLRVIFSSFADETHSL